MAKKKKNWENGTRVIEAWISSPLPLVDGKMPAQRGYGTCPSHLLFGSSDPVVLCLCPHTTLLSQSLLNKAQFSNLPHYPGKLREGQPFCNLCHVPNDQTISLL